MKNALALSALAVATLTAAASAAEPPRPLAVTLANCFLQEADFNFSLKRTVQDKATIFVAKKDGNAFQVCLNTRQTLFVQGLLVPGSLMEEDGDLVLETVTTKRPVPAEDAAKGSVRGADWVGAGGLTYEISGRFKHRIPLERITYDELESQQNTTSVEKSGWLTLVLEPKGKIRAAAVRVKDDDAAAGEKLVRRALGTPKLDSSFKDAASVEKIAGFVKTELPKHAASGGPMIKTPMIYVELAVNKSAQESEPVNVVDIVARGRNAGSDSRGEPIVDALDYDQLIYCRQESRLETRREHNAHLSSAARMAAGK